jgi:hypothetical protein
METPMPEQRKPTPRSRKEPRFLRIAQAFYGDAFEVHRATDLSAAMADWSELTEDEQSFTLAHLHYLNLLAQAATQKLLLQVRDLLDEVADGIGEVLEDDADDDPEDDQLEDHEGFDGEQDPAHGLDHQADIEAEAEAELEIEHDDAEPGSDGPDDEEE